MKTIEEQDKAFEELWEKLPSCIRDSAPESEKAAAKFAWREAYQAGISEERVRWLAACGRDAWANHDFTSVKGKGEELGADWSDHWYIPLCVIPEVKK